MFHFIIKSTIPRLSHHVHPVGRSDRRERYAIGLPTGWWERRGEVMWAAGEERRERETAHITLRHSVPFTLPSVHAVGGSPKGATRRGTPPAVRRALRGEWIGREPTWQRNEEPTRWTSGVGTREEPWDARPLFLCSFVTLHLMVRLSGSSLIPSPSPSRRRPRSDCKERAESEASREAAVRREWRERRPLVTFPRSYRSPLPSVREVPAVGRSPYTHLRSVSPEGHA